MAKYTVELKDIDKSGMKIFDFDYEFYDSTKKADFEKKFVNHFYFREIGVETVGRFQHNLKCKCDEVLPYYNMLFRTALIDYDKLTNFKMTETYVKSKNKEDTITADTSGNGETDNVTSNNNTLNHTLNNTNEAEKINVLNSDTTHTEILNDTHEENVTENKQLNKTSNNTQDGKKIGSDTPTALLSMEDITNNVYASNADIEHTVNAMEDEETGQATKENNITNTANNTVNDKVQATNTDNTTVTNHETVTDINFGTNTNKGTFENNVTSNQNIESQENENYTKETIGNNGLIVEADLLQKHIQLQQTLTKIYSMFFNECEDLFMQIY